MTESHVSKIRYFYIVNKYMYFRIKETYKLKTF